MRRPRTGEVGDNAPTMDTRLKGPKSREPDFRQSVFKMS